MEGLYLAGNRQAFLFDLAQNLFAIVPRATEPVRHLAAPWQQPSNATSSQASARALVANGRTAHEELGALHRVATPARRRLKEPCTALPKTGLTFDMSGDTKAQPLWHPLDGMVRQRPARMAH
jgi:hypothetical protein